MDETRPERTMRRTFLALVAVVGASVPTAAAAEPAVAVASVAPYVDMSNSQESMLDAAATSAGLRSYTAAFVIGTGCTQVWGDTLPVGNDPNVDSAIARARSEGASPIISSGGAAGLALAWSCTDQGAIEAGYQKIIDAYGVNSLDFDIEGAAVADKAAAA